MQTFSIMAAPAPQLLRDYLIYMSTIKGRSPRTVEAYYNDLRLFLRYLMATRSGAPLPTDDPNLESISFASISEEMILSARLSDAYSFLAYVQSVNQNNAKTRARKVSSLRGFYKYLQSKAGRLEENPMEQLEIPAQRKSLPKYLTLDESLHLLESIEGRIVNAIIVSSPFCLTVAFVFRSWSVLSSRISGMTPLLYWARGIKNAWFILTALVLTPSQNIWPFVRNHRKMPINPTCWFPPVPVHHLPPAGWNK